MNYFSLIRSSSQAPSWWCCCRRARPSACQCWWGEGTRQGQDQCWPGDWVLGWGWCWGSWSRVTTVELTWTRQSHWGWQCGAGLRSHHCQHTCWLSSWDHSPQPRSSSVSGGRWSVRWVPRSCPLLQSWVRPVFSWGWTRGWPPSSWCWWLRVWIINTTLCLVCWWVWPWPRSPSPWVRMLELAWTLLLTPCLGKCCLQSFSPSHLKLGCFVIFKICCCTSNLLLFWHMVTCFVDRVVAAIYRQSWQPFNTGDRFWMIPFLVPYLGSVIAVSVYSLFIERLSLSPVSQTKLVTSKNVKYFDP